MVGLVAAEAERDGFTFAPAACGAVDVPPLGLAPPAVLRILEMLRKVVLF
jgi:hypothetical protein